MIRNGIQLIKGEAITKKGIVKYCFMALAVLFAFIVLQGAFVSSAQADLIINGGFTPIQSGFVTVDTGAATIPGWTVTQGSVDWIGDYWQAPVLGQGSIDLDGFYQAGGLSQTFGTTSGQSYAVSFALSGNPGGGPTTKSLLVSVGEINQTFSYVMDLNNSINNMQYRTESFVFTASESTTTLTFTSLDSSDNAWGPVIGDVTVNAVPLPSALLLFAPGLAGLAMLRKRLKK
jgi:choice-of-anchor C domain-containing protein